MQFKTTDLFVTVLPKAEIDKQLAKVCLLRTIICRNPTLLCNPASLNCFKGSLGCDLRPSLCGPCSFQGSFGCGAFGSCGGPGGSACDPTYFCAGASRDPFIIEHLEDLVTLKADLQATLKGLEAMQKEGLPSAIASKADADALERGLTEALEQVRAAKKSL